MKVMADEKHEDKPKKETRKLYSEIKLQTLVEFHDAECKQIVARKAELTDLLQKTKVDATPRITGDALVPSLQRYIDIMDKRQEWIEVCLARFPEKWDSHIFQVDTGDGWDYNRFV